MASVKTKFMVGIFVLVGIAAAAMLAFWIGMSHYFEKGRLYAAYFDQSVQGLEKDSAVKYRGVSIGRVETVRVAPDGFLIEVIMKIENDLNMDNMVAQLKSIGLTGIMFIELDRRQKSGADSSPKITFKPKYPVIPTKPSVITRFMEVLDALSKRLEDLNLDRLISTAESVISNINQVAKEADLRTLIEETSKTLRTFREALVQADIGQLSEGIQRSVESIEKLAGNENWNEALTAVESAAKSLQSVSKSADQTVKKARGAIDPLEKLVAQNKAAIDNLIKTLNETADGAKAFFQSGTDLVSSEGYGLGNLQNLLVQTLEQLQSLSDNLNNLVDTLSAQPSRLFLGEPPPERNFEK